MHELSFRTLGVSVQIEQVLAKRGILRPFPIQELVLPDALAGRDVLAKSPTGSGKTLAFAIPIVARVERDRSQPAALVLVPTRELCGQVTEEIAPLAAVNGLRVAAVFGGAPMGQQAKKARNAQILVATPGRLQDMVTRRLVSLEQVRLLVLDEADRMLDMGFKPQVERLLRSLPRERQTMLFSATLDGEVGELAHSYTSDPSRFETAPIRDDNRSDRSSTDLSRSQPTPRSSGWSRSFPKSADWHSSSSAPSAAPIDSPTSWRVTRSTLCRCTGAWLRTPASARFGVFAPAR